MLTYYQLAQVVALFAIVSTMCIQVDGQSQMRPGCEPNCAAELLQFISKCDPTSACDIEFLPGTYTFNDESCKLGQPSIGVFNMDSLRLFASVPGSVTINIHGFRGGFWFSDCTYLTIDGLSFDMDRLPFTYGQATSVDSTGTEITFDPQLYPFPAEDTETQWLYAAQSVLQYDPAQGRPAVNALDIYQLDDPYPLLVNTANNTLRVQGLGAAQHAHVGDWYILRHQVYGLNTFSFSGCDQVKIVNVTLYSAAGMGFYAQDTRDITMLQTSIRKGPKNDRPMSINADGLHFTRCMGEVFLDELYFDGQGDDGGNINGLFVDIESIVTPHIIRVGKDGVVASTAGEIQFARAGDQLEIRSRRTFEVLFTTTLNAVKSDGSCELTDALPSFVSKYDLVTSITRLPSVHLMRSTFTNNRARGFLMKTSNVLIEGCVFDHNSGTGVQAFPDGCYWFEANAFRNWTLTTSQFIGCNYGPGQIGSDVYIAACVPQWQDGVPTTNGVPSTQGTPYANIVIENCIFEQDQGQAAVTVYGSDGLQVVENVVSLQSGAPQPKVNFVLSNSLDISTSGNSCGQSTCVYNYNPM
eukprot:TRINITY_DN443_c0_g1_i1.p1 TRINITY_DN443_c0_g1~~TRINITY_DN443_c0_g1_i1.p1  ORF type:complete len:582 (+),score=91.52 TRINITY_DN443_c0_g1_i1:133-1878(+)